MDTWKFYDITHREHVVCNPTSEAKLARLVELLRLPKDAQVVDIACGKGEFLIRLAEAYGARGMGIDISPYHIADAQKSLIARTTSTGISFIQINGGDFKPDKPHSFELASCIGASWIFGGYANTLDALIGMVKPGGWVVVGEPYWRQEPSEDYLAAVGCAREDFGSHSSNAEAGERRGMDLVHTIVSSEDDWDRYEGLQWFATAEYARAHPDDPDLAEVLECVSKTRAAYLCWGRDTLGWALYMFRSRSA
ncbi:MAG TPA: class I SAM-dependent methyltransferase [Candidatus Hydrogenedentes bacterium]|nr:class I SAM-dependent methyltransferase [Candidatus Hydrogenedentota bacterium]